MRRILSRLVVATVLGLSMATPSGVRADGALAFASYGEDDCSGWAVGYSAARARAIALEECRKCQARGTAARCRIVATFRGQCVAVAYAGEGIDGYGWAVAATEAAAQRQAIATCRRAGPRAAQTCRVASSGCD